MKPSALVISASPNEALISFGDAKSVAIGLERAGYKVDFAPQKELIAQGPDLAISSYDLIFYEIPGSALHRSTPANYEFFTRLHRDAKDGALTLHYCDVSFSLDPNIWNPQIGREGSKVNLMADRPVRIMGSFSADILEDPAAMEVIGKRVLSKIHPDSSFVPIEWNILNYLRLEEQGGFDQPKIETSPRFERFYYGLNKPKLVPSLKALGLGESENDAVLGPISKSFPHVRSLNEAKQSGGKAPWQPHTRLAKKVLIPYEPIKGDYQITLRFLEALLFYPDRALVDPQIAEWMQPMVCDHALWRERIDQAVERMAGLHLGRGEATVQLGSSAPIPPIVRPKAFPNPRSTTMALANYKITDLSVDADEDGNRSITMLTRHGVIAAYAPGFSLDDPFDLEDADKWLDNFAEDKLAQKAQQVVIEVRDVRQLSEDAEELLAAKLQEVEQVKEEISLIAAAYLRTITKEELAAGPIHPLSPGSKTLVDAVEFQRRRIGKSASKVLEENPNLPAHVKKPLTDRAATDAKNTIERVNATKETRDRKKAEEAEAAKATKA